MFGMDFMLMERIWDLLEDFQNLPKEWIVSAGALFVTVLGAWMVPRYYKRHQFAVLRKQKKDTCIQALKNLKDKLEREGQLGDKEVSRILKLSLKELTSQLQTGELSAVHVLEAYQKRALEVHEKTNCLVEPIWEADVWALEADQLKGPKPPLHGVPISVKDIFGVEGYDSTVGCAKYIDKPMKDCVVIKVLKSQGAIPFVKTNVPQSMISWENTNPIFGQTLNPRDLSRGPGGSSGGEAALVAGGGSVLGIGSDIGGSIRIPAACCGVYGYKLTGGRTSLVGMQYASEGQLIVPVANGPLARDVHSLVCCIKALLSREMFELDTYTPPTPFREDMYNELKGKKLRIGYYIDDDFFTPVPPVVRAVEEAVRALQADGHDVVKWDFSNHTKNFMRMWPKIVFADQGKDLCNLVKNDKTDDAIGTLISTLTMSKLTKKIISFVLRPFWRTMSFIMYEFQGIDSVYAWWNHVKNVKGLRNEVVEDWKANRFDAVIAPGIGCIPLPVGHAKYALGCLSYTTAFNFLNFPAGSMPVTTVTVEDLETPYKVKDPFHWCAKRAMKGAVGLPVNIQIANLPWQDEKGLYIMGVLERVLKKISDPGFMDTDI